MSTGTDIATSAPATGRNFSWVEYPNPFSDNLSIRIEVYASENVKLQIFDMAGRLVKTLINSVLPVGSQIITWDGKTESGEIVKEGIYFCTLQTIKDKEIRKILLIHK